MPSVMPLAGAAVVIATLLGGCSSAPAPPQDVAPDLADKVGVDGMYVHLRKLQEIADANDRSRAEGTSGYDASVDYVAQTLREKGFDVQTPEYEHLGVARPGNPTLAVSGRRYPVDQASLLTPTAAGGLRAVTLRPRKPAGCAAADYGTKTMKGAIAVVDDTGCSVVDKQDTAVAEGAVGLLVVSDLGHRAARRGCSHRATSGFEGAGRGDRQRRRRRAAPHRRAGAADARCQGGHGEVTKRGGAKDRRPPVVAARIWTP